MKLGCWSHLCKSFNFKKLHRLSHLFTSDNLIENKEQLPCMKYEVIDIVAYSQKKVYDVIQTHYANIKCRNFPVPVDKIKKKLKLKDGGQYFLFATTSKTNKPIIIITIKK